MARHKKKGFATQYGTRYGKTNRQKLAKVNEQYKHAQTCPYCSYDAVKRVSVGIWSCKKCHSTFVSKAYKVDKLKSLSKPTEA